MRLLRKTCGPTFVFAGLMHFQIPEVYERIMPPYLPAHRLLVLASGAAEAAGGLGLMVPAARRPAGWWLIATMVAVFPANLHMAQHPEAYPEIPGGTRTLWARLPLQAAFIAWILAAMRDGAARPADLAGPDLIDPDLAG